jgi:DNA-binding HxlR family transcriptional regulator
MASSTTPSALEEAVARVGDRWTLLLVDALLQGPRKFNELLDDLDGLASNVLSKRLKQLEADGVVVSTPYSRKPMRVEYRLSATGAELAGALRLLRAWGADHAGEVAAPFHHDACGTPVEPRWWCPTCERVVGDDEADDLNYA